jgi:FkbM family methyltransferase
LCGQHIGSGGSVAREASGERNAIEYIANKSCDYNYVVFDVGANVGKYTNMIKEVLPNAAVYAFEPSKITFQELSKNTANLNDVRLYNFGFSDSENSLTLYYDHEKSGIASVYKRNLAHFQIDMNREETISVTSLDDFCAKNDIKHIDLLKLDIEGHELMALQGARNLLAENCIDYLQFEFGGCNIDSRTYFQDFFYLLKDKWNIYRIVRDGLYPITSYKETLECFVTTNFLAELKSKS